MRLLKTILFTFGFSCILVSCSKNEVSIQEEVTDYSNLSIGNFWVYNWYDVSSDKEELIRESDSVIISETTIEGRKYYVKSPHMLGVSASMLFDSANAIYSYPNRLLIFSLDKNQKETITFGTGKKEFATSTYKLIEELETISVPAGIYDCLNWQGEVIASDKDYPYGIRYNDNYYSKNIGLVKMRTHYYNSPNNLEMRLVTFGNLNK